MRHFLALLKVIQLARKDCWTDSLEKILKTLEQEGLLTHHELIVASNVLEGKWSYNRLEIFFNNINQKVEEIVMDTVAFLLANETVNKLLEEMEALEHG